jgi:hypothetical protein
MIGQMGRILSRLNSPRPLVILGLLLTLLVSYGIGVAAAAKGESFNWEVASVAGTAFATAALAGFTAWLAYVTASDLANNERAVPVVTRAGLLGGPDDPPVSVVQLKNAGLAPAVYITLEIECLDKDGHTVMSGTSTNELVLAPTEDGEVHIPLSPTVAAPFEMMVVKGTFFNRSFQVKRFKWRRNRKGQAFIYPPDHRDVRE